MKQFQVTKRRVRLAAVCGVALTAGLAPGLAFALAFAPALVAPAAATEVAFGEQVPIARLLNPDGTLNTSTGLTGSVNVAGYRMVTGTKGAPRFVPQTADSDGSGAAIAASGNPDDSWDNRFFFPPGVDGEVYALAVSGTDLYVGGWFTTAGGKPSSNFAIWHLPCGDGVVQAGEQCDDGNTNNTDACKNDCTFNVCGDGFVYTGVEQCDDGNTTGGDRTCTFKVALCFNNEDARFACTPTDVARVQLLLPREAQPRDATDLANRNAIEAALVGVNGAVRGQCTLPVSKLHQLCSANADCDSTPGSGNGVCATRFVLFEPPLSARNRCTDFALVQVPLHNNRMSSRTIRLSATPSNDPVTGRKRAADTDALRLVCRPKP